MRKKPARRLVMSNPEKHPSIQDWHNVPEEEFFLYARAFRAAAKKMALAVELAPGPSAKSPLAMVVFMYRHALELHLKALILGDGGNFLATKPDRLSVYRTHSVSWLSQFVCQIVTAVNWEKEFRCEGMRRLPTLRLSWKISIPSILAHIRSAIPPASKAPDSVRGNSTFDAREFGRRIDALLDLLDSTADALAATWDTQSEAAALYAALYVGKDIEPTIQSWGRASRRHPLSNAVKSGRLGRYGQSAPVRAPVAAKMKTCRRRLPYSVSPSYRTDHEQGKRDFDT